MAKVSVGAEKIMPKAIFFSIRKIFPCSSQNIDNEFFKEKNRLGLPILLAQKGKKHCENVVAHCWTFSNLPRSQKDARQNTH
ncbi:MAG: hypothetical protein KF734_16915 [Saprospiraceae bacterium]|nr:hypothetical protein [Saprospiraceae bacterium]